MYALLKGIDKFGSLNEACRGVCAYSCAWNTLIDSEANYSVILIDRKGPKGSKLTEAARLLMSKLECADKYVDKLNEELFAEFDKLDSHSSLAGLKKRETKLMIIDNSDAFCLKCNGINKTTAKYCDQCGCEVVDLIK